jgi:TonB-linked SusC/RagA family outer membrane protein
MKKLLRLFLVCVFLLLINAGLALAQQRTIKGTVKDEKGITMPGVTVKVKGTTIGTQTTVDGKYSINAPSVSSVLVFTFVGYAPLEFPAGSTLINVTMQAQSGSLNEVVVLGFGSTQKKINLTGSVSTVSGQDLVATPVANISNALVGSAPGISGLQTSGEPGRNTTNLYIRGQGTYGNANPLIVIDGVQQPAERAFDELNAIDANEIQGISILKDAASTAVYGIRGANGVIIVTTKRGKAGSATVSLSANFGTTKATNLQKDVSSYEWAVMRNEAIRTAVSSFGNASYSAYLLTPDDLWKFQNNRDYTPAEVAAMSITDAQKTQLNNSPALYYGSHDLYAEQFGKNGPQEQMNLNVSGGTDKVKYFTSMGYYSQSSITNAVSYYGSNTGSNFNRYNFRSNFDVEAAKNLTISLNLSGQFGTSVGPGTAASPYDLSGRYKVIEQYLYDGNPFTTPGIIDNHLINAFAGTAGTAANPLGLRLGSSIGSQNAVYNLLISGTGTLYNTLLDNSIIVKHTMDYLTPGLSIHATANYQDNYTKAVTQNPSLPVYSVRRDAVNPNNLDFYGGAIGVSAFNPNPGNNFTWRKNYYDAGINYNRTFNGHTIGALLVGNAQLYTQPGDANNTPSGLMGLVGQVSYNYKERYMLLVNVGYNGTEQFAPGKRFGYFPSYSAGWVPTNEPFFPKNDIVTFIKLRASYGQVGNDLLGTTGRRYLYFPNTYSQNTGNGYYYGSSNGSVTNPYYAGTTEGAIGNPDVTWERSKNLDLGFEARFFNDRLNFLFDYFKQDRNNILTNLGTIPVTYGVPSGSVPPVNVGITQNKGYEITLGWTDKIGKVGYSISGDVSFARNKIIYQAEAPNPYPWMNRTGFTIGQNFGLVSDGFFNNQAELDNRPYNTYTSNQAALGDIRYKDINGDGLINNKDNVPIGYPNLAQYHFNLRLRLNYKGFDISTLFNGTANGSFYLNSGLTIPFFKVAGNAWKWEYDGRWTPEKVASGQAITYPRSSIDGTSSSNNYLTSDFWEISSAFKRFKNAEIGYTFQQYSWLKRAKISSLRLYANGNNLFTWDSALKKEGIDAETTDGSTYIFPLTRVFTFGLSAKF